MTWARSCACGASRSGRWWATPFPTGCAYSDKIVFPRFFEANPDFRDPRFSTRNGVYEEGCGLDAVNLSWGHDEYIYHVCKDYLPIEGLYMLRYHSLSIRGTRRVSMTTCATTRTGGC
jgi:hypothetical protein